MSGVGNHKESRQTVKPRDTSWQATKQIMADKDTPGWAVHMITEVTGIRESFKQSFDELNEQINGLKKETRATLSRVTNAEKRISAGEDQMAGESTTLNDMTKEMDLLKNELTTFEAHSKIILIFFKFTVPKNELPYFPHYKAHLSISRSS